MKLENPILLELESRSKSNPNSLASRLNLLANDLMDTTLCKADRFCRSHN